MATLHTAPDPVEPELHLAALRARLPDFWWSEIERVRTLIDADDANARFEAAYLEHAAEALAMTEDPELAHTHAPALWAASHQLSLLARRRKHQAPPAA